MESISSSFPIAFPIKFYYQYATTLSFENLNAGPHSMILFLSIPLIHTFNFTTTANSSIPPIRYLYSLPTSSSDVVRPGTGVEVAVIFIFSAFSL